MDGRNDTSAQDGAGMSNSAARGLAPRAVLALIALAVGAVIALAGCATAAQSHSAAADRHGSHSASHHGASRPAALTVQQTSATARQTFRAFDQAGRLTVPVARDAKGYCWSTSVATPSQTTFRCFAGNQILDPCFARPGSGGAVGSTVACVADPWSKAVVLTLTKRLPRADVTTHRVWAFLRSDGARCVAATGTVSFVQGHNLPYNCSDGTSAALTNGQAQRVGTVFAKPTAKTLSRASVRTIWTT